MDDKVSIKRPLESPIPREEIEEDVSSIERHRSLDQNDLSDAVDNNKVEKNRERNREHAKRTRQRKKEMMEGMKIRLLELQREVHNIFVHNFCIIAMFRFFFPDYLSTIL